jgi:hypothetical protein
MQNNRFVEVPLADHFEVTDKCNFPDGEFSWPCSDHKMVVPIGSANPNKHIYFQELSITDILEKVGYLASCQDNPLTIMRLEADFREDGLVDISYTGYSLAPIDMLSNTGHSLEMAITYYQNKGKPIVLYASCNGYYWIASQTKDIGVF